MSETTKRRWHNRLLVSLCPLTNYQQQSHMLALLFRELALAVRHKFPLDLVLEGIADSRKIRPGSGYLHFTLLILFGAIAILTALAGHVEGGIAVLVLGGLTLLALRVRRHDDFVRYVANQLGYFLVRGRTLSQAMQRMTLIFSSQTRQTVALGEKTEHLAEALETLADYHGQAGRFNRLFAAFFYPLAVFTLCLGPLGFILVKIVPKYVDIFAQLGLDLPAQTQWLVRQTSGGWLPAFTLFGVAFPFLLLVLITVVIPRALNGSTLLTGIFLILLAVLFGFAVFPTMVATGDRLPTGPVSLLAPIVVGAALSVGLAAGLYQLLRWVNVSLVPLMQDAVVHLLAWARPIQKLQLSRFLLSLGYSLRAQIPLPDALDMAGRIVGPQLRRETVRLRTLVEQGHSLSEGLDTSPLVRGQVRAILSLAEWRNSLADDCIELAGQLRAEAELAAERLAAFVEWPSIILVGIILGFFTICMYLPLFTIPHVIGGFE